jgi:glycolate oxidase FAD binding subunit
MIKPETEAQLAQVVADATGPLCIRGGGTRGAAAAGQTVSLAGLAGVTLYEPGALTLVVQSGTPVTQIEALLAAEGQRLAFETMDHRGLLGTQGTPTIGGVVAANISGPRRIQAGACRDNVLGVRFVDGRGQVVKNGGRVMKNVTGYDLVKLLAGSWGTLGVLSEVALKVQPQPETSACLILEGLSDTDALTAMTRALGSPFDVTGAAHIPGDQPQTFLRIEGFERSIAYRLAQLQAMFHGPQQAVQDPSQVAQNWAEIRDLRPMHGTDGDVWRVSTRPSNGPEIVERAGARRALYDWGGGLIWLDLPPGTDLRAKLGTFDGHATLVRACAQTRAALPMFHPQPAPIAALSAGLRAQFDPRGILNPGLMG